MLAAKPELFELSNLRDDLALNQDLVALEATEAGPLLSFRAHLERYGNRVESFPEAFHVYAAELSLPVGADTTHLEEVARREHDRWLNSGAQEARRSPGPSCCRRSSRI